MQEFLVIFACLNSTGCSETAGAYRASHPELEKIIRHHEERVKDYVGPVVVQMAAPFFIVVAGGTGNIRITQNFGLQIKNYQQPQLVFSRSF